MCWNFVKATINLDAKFMPGSKRHLHKLQAHFATMAFCFPQVADELYEYLGVILDLWREKFEANGVSFKKY